MQWFAFSFNGFVCRVCCNNWLTRQLIAVTTPRWRWWRSNSVCHWDITKTRKMSQNLPRPPSVVTKNTRKCIWNAFRKFLCVSLEYIRNTNKKKKKYKIQIFFFYQHYYEDRSSKILGLWKLSKKILTEKLYRNNWRWI